jgi:cytochrome c-type biogenesis protein CcmE
MNRTLKFGIGGGILVAAIGYLMYAGLQQSATYYFTIDEFLPRKQELAGQGVRVAGRVAEGSLWKQTSAKGTEMRFAIGEFRGPDEPAGETLLVAYTGLVPDMFAEGRDVIVEGHYDDGTMHAQTVMTSCPSKYEPELDGEPGPGAAAAAR